MNPNKVIPNPRKVALKKILPGVRGVLEDTVGSANKDPSLRKLGIPYYGPGW